MDRGLYLRFAVVVGSAILAGLQLWPTIDDYRLDQNPEAARTAPEWVTDWFPGRISPGLDIRGGLRLQYEVEVEEYIRDRRDTLSEQLVRKLGVLLEIYGATECGQLASRRTTEGAAWTLLPGVQLEQDGDETIASGGHVEGRVVLSDLIELLPEHRFLLHGRHADLVNIAGRRTSLAYLNHQIAAIPGVTDAAFFLPDEAGPDGITRLTAFVVAPELNARALTAELRQRLDAIFLPRPLVFVDRLPRNSTGKLPRSELQALYAERVAHGRR